MGEQVTLTARERSLVRHAIGLPNERHRSYRNRYFAGPKTELWHEWTPLVDRHLATFEAAGSLDCFTVTRALAEAALEPGERLDLEDFPHD